MKAWGISPEWQGSDNYYGNKIKEILKDGDSGEDLADKTAEGMTTPIKNNNIGDLRVSVITPSFDDAVGGEEGGGGGGGNEEDNENTDENNAEAKAEGRHSSTARFPVRYSDSPKARAHRRGDYLHIFCAHTLFTLSSCPQVSNMPRLLRSGLKSSC